MRRRLVWVFGLAVLIYASCESNSHTLRVSARADSAVTLPPGLRIPVTRPPASLTGARRERVAFRESFISRIVRGNPSRKEVALTFDDGPHAGKTEKLLDILRKEQVHATFFVVGKMVDRHPELVRLIAADGHEVANHTYD